MRFLGKFKENFFWLGNDGLIFRIYRTSTELQPKETNSIPISSLQNADKDVYSIWGNLGYFSALEAARPFLTLL